MEKIKLGKPVRNEFPEKLYRQFWLQLLSQSDSQLGLQIRSRLGYRQLSDQLDDSLGSHLREQLISQLWLQIHNHLENK